MVVENKEKKTGSEKRGSLPRSLRRLLPVQENKHTAGAQKVQAESEATLGQGKTSHEFQDSSVTGFL